jgi:hypothetical protein
MKNRYSQTLYQPFVVFIDREEAKSVLRSVYKKPKDALILRSMMESIDKLPSVIFSEKEICRIRKDSGAYVDNRILLRSGVRSYIKRTDVLLVINQENRISFHKRLVANVQGLPIISFSPEKVPL